MGQACERGYMCFTKCFSFTPDTHSVCVIRTLLWVNQKILSINHFERFLNTLEHLFLFLYCCYGGISLSSYDLQRKVREALQRMADSARIPEHEAARVSYCFISFHTS